MSLNNPIGGYNYGTEFQSSALPWVTASVMLKTNGEPTKFDFPCITKDITVSNNDLVFSSSCAFAFNQNDLLTSSSYTLRGGQSIHLNVKAKSIWIRGENSVPLVTITAGLTTIPSRQVPDYSGSLVPSVRNPRVWLNYAPEFQGSGTPWLTSSVLPANGAINQIQFPSVAKEITITNNENTINNGLRVAFTLDDALSSNNAITLLSSRSIELKLKTDTVYLRGETYGATYATPRCSIAASLTNVPRQPQLISTPLVLRPQLWLRADLGITVATGVSQWADQSGNGNHVVQATPVRQPEFNNNLYEGLPGVWWRFPTSSANSCKLASTTTIAVSGDFEWYTIVYMSTVDMAALLTRPADCQLAFTVSLEDTGYTNKYQMMAAYSATNTLTGWTAGGSTNRYGTITLNKPVLLAMRRSASTVIGIRDNNNYSIANGTNMSSAKPIVIGGAGIDNTAPHAGSIMEVLTFNRALSTMERSALLNYFSNRYKQAWS